MLVIATLFFASQDALTKHLMKTLAASQIVSVRFLFFVLFALWYSYRHGGIRVTLRTKHPWMQIVRGLLLACEIILFAYAIQFLGLAEMHTIFACFPLIITALSVPMLRETVGWRRWLAVLFGFIGTLIILRPDTDVFQLSALVALISALMFAVYTILTRKVSRNDSVETSLLYMALAGFLCAAIIAPFNWQPVSMVNALWLLLISTTSIIGHLLLIKALALVSAVILQPFNYFILIWAIIIGFILYGEVLSPIDWLGASIVVGSGIFIARREYQLSKQSVLTA